MYTREDARRIFTVADINGDGTLDFEEAMEAILQLMSEPYMAKERVQTFCDSVIDPLADPATEEGHVFSKLLSGCGGVLDEYTITELGRSVYGSLQSHQYASPLRKFDAKSFQTTYRNLDLDGSRVFEPEEVILILKKFLFDEFYIEADE